MNQLAALDESVEGFDIPSAVLEIARGLAAAIDEDPSNAAMWREYRAAVDAVMEVVNGSPDDDAAEFQRSIVTPLSAALRNRKNA